MGRATLVAKDVLEAIEANGLISETRSARLSGGPRLYLECGLVYGLA